MDEFGRRRDEQIESELIPNLRGEVHFQPFMESCVRTEDGYRLGSMLLLSLYRPMDKDSQRLTTLLIIWSVSINNVPFCWCPIVFSL